MTGRQQDVSKHSPLCDFRRTKTEDSLQVPFVSVGHTVLLSVQFRFSACSFATYLQMDPLMMHTVHDLVKRVQILEEEKTNMAKQLNQCLA